MIIFLFFHGAYWLAHLYLFFKFRNAFPLDIAGSAVLSLFLVFMALSPMSAYILILRAEHTGIKNRTYANAVMFSGFIWMGLLIIFFFVSIPIDLYNLGVRLAGFALHNDISKIMISQLSAFFIPLSTSICLNIYGYFAAGDLRVERLTIKTSKLPEDVDRLTIAQISDVHLGIMVREKMLDKIIDNILTEEPDLIVSTGDLIDGGTKHIRHFAEKLKGVNARLGKFAVIGNHEFYSGIKNSIQFLEDAGFTVFRGRGVTAGGLINIAGIDDAEGRRKNIAAESEKEILSRMPSGLFTLLLKHKPDVEKDALGLFDLQLSGHTHKGQIFPINLAVRLFFYPHSSYKKLSKGSAINVSGGAGTAGPPIRLFSPPEITIIELVNDKINIKEHKAFV
ncbi:MAG: metallophosphoesterase [Nitrospirae bacterium]|nr:metallophosphoesterase [Nitrospirota bacterium]